VEDLSAGAVADDDVSFVSFRSDVESGVWREDLDDVAPGAVAQVQRAPAAVELDRRVAGVAGGIEQITPPSG
jgi:hypothetical protein